MLEKQRYMAKDIFCVKYFLDKYYVLYYIVIIDPLIHFFNDTITYIKVTGNKSKLALLQFL